MQIILAALLEEWTNIMGIKRLMAACQFYILYIILAFNESTTLSKFRCTVWCKPSNVSGVQCEIQLLKYSTPGLVPAAPSPSPSPASSSRPPPRWGSSSSSQPLSSSSLPLSSSSQPQPLSSHPTPPPAPQPARPQDQRPQVRHRGEWGVNLFN